MFIFLCFYDMYFLRFKAAVKYDRKKFNLQTLKSNIFVITKYFLMRFSAFFFNITQDFKNWIKIEKFPHFSKVLTTLIYGACI